MCHLGRLPGVLPQQPRRLALQLVQAPHLVELGQPAQELGADAHVAVPVARLDARVRRPEELVPRAVPPAGGVGQPLRARLRVVEGDEQGRVGVADEVAALGRRLGRQVRRKTSRRVLALVVAGAAAALLDDGAAGRGAGEGGVGQGPRRLAAPAASAGGAGAFVVLVLAEVAAGAEGEQDVGGRLAQRVAPDGLGLVVRHPDGAGVLVAGVGVLVARLVFAEWFEEGGRGCRRAGPDIISLRSSSFW